MDFNYQEVAILHLLFQPITDFNYNSCYIKKRLLELESSQSQVRYSLQLCKKKYKKKYFYLIQLLKLIKFIYYKHITKIVEFKQLEEYNQSLEGAKDLPSLSEAREFLSNRNKQWHRIQNLDQNFNGSIIYQSKIDELQKQFSKGSFQFQVKDLDIENSQISIKVKAKYLDPEPFYKELQFYGVLHYIGRLGKYPEQDIKYEEVKIWQLINSKNVKFELDTLFNSQKQFSYNNKLVLDLQRFTQFKDQVICSKSYMGLEFLFKYSCLKNSNEEDFKVVEKFLKMIENLQDKSLSSLIMIMNEVDEAIQVIQSQEAKCKKILELLSGSQELIFFCNQNPGIRYQEFGNGYQIGIELTNTQVFSDMTFVDDFVCSLTIVLQNKQQIRDYKSLLDAVIKQINNSQKIKKNFDATIQNCLDNFKQIQLLHQLNYYNKENTISKIWVIMDAGTAILRMEKDQCIFEIEYNDDYIMKVATQQKIKQYCSRAILISQDRSSGEKKSDQIIKDAQKQRMQIQNLIQKVQKFMIIRKFISTLSQNGHMKFKGRFMEKFNIASSSQQQLEMLIEEYQTLTDHWKTQLENIRKEYYYMTYFPNSQLSALIDSILSSDIQNPLSNSLFRYVNPSSSFENFLKKLAPEKLDELKSLDSYELQLEKCSQMIDSYFKQIKHSMDNKNEYYAALEVNQKIFKKEIYRVFLTKSRYENIRAISSIFFLSKYKPDPSQIMFCHRNTKASEIECFLLRAMFFNAKREQKQQRIFILSDFQKLKVHVQMESQRLLEVYSAILNEKFRNLITSQDYSCSLFILVAFDQQSKDHLIEQMQNIEEFASYIEDGMLASFFKTDIVKIVTSERAQIGKSTYIKRKAIKSRKSYIKIPFQGDISKSKIRLIHQERLSDISSEEAENPCFHYQINPSLGEDLNIVLFELLMLGGIFENDKYIYFLPQNRVTYIEISQESRKDHNKSLFLHLFSDHTELKWNIKYFSSSLFSEELSYFSQLSLKCLIMIKQRNFKFETIDNQNQLICDEKASEIYSEYFLPHLNEENINFGTLFSFISFSGDQLGYLTRPESFFRANTIKELFPRNSEAFLINLVQFILDNVRKFCIKTQSIKNQQLCQNRDASIQEGQGVELANINWKFQEDSFISVNSDGSITPIFRKFSKCPDIIKEFYEQFKALYSRNKGIHGFNDKLAMLKLEMENFEEFIRQNPDDIIERIFSICQRNYENFKRLDRKDEGWFDQYRLVWTADNFIKFSLINLWIRSKQPVNIMGETGVGKTALVEYLKDVSNIKYFKLYIHEGITEKEIIEFMNNVIESKTDKLQEEISMPQIYLQQASANIQEENKKLKLVFFDELNTNFNSYGLLKELMIERTMNGKSIPDHIRFVSSCNPYKLRIENNSKGNFTSGIMYKNINKQQDNLVYKVYPMPESMFPFVQDYGILSIDEQEIYIRKIISKVAKFTENYSSEIIDFMARVVVESHKFIITNFSSSHVSLRDVDRFRKLFIFFHKNHKKVITNDSKFNKEEKQRCKMQEVLILTLNACYKLSFDDKKLRKEYNNKISEITPEPFIILDKYIKLTILKEYQRYIEFIEIPTEIGINDSLKENIFALVVMIINKIPIYIVGKPGSSKTLALNLILKSMKGISSKNEFFQKLPTLRPYTFQGSIQTTSESIDKLFRTSSDAYHTYKEEKKWLRKKLEDSKNQSEIIEQLKLRFVVIIDEIGLAQQSPYNPLKVLHSHLDKFEVAFVGISNWALDVSKRNRGISLQKLDPKECDLINSAISQFKNICSAEALDSSRHNQLNQEFEKNYLKKIVEFYNSYCHKQEENYHGLRDFYQLICFISYRVKEGMGFEQAIVQGVIRNFGGLKKYKGLSFFNKLFPKISIIFVFTFIKKAIQQTSSKQLIEQNLKDKFSRNLMVVNEHQETLTLKHIERVCTQNKRLYQIFAGSNFEKDLKEYSIKVDQVTLFFFNL